jgi:phospholipase/carboxylesterase
MKRSDCTIAGLSTAVVTAPQPQIDVVLLHGYAMQASDLTPFAHSLGIAARFLIPTAPQAAEVSGCSWWTIDEAARRVELANGPRDLATFHPANRTVARNLLLQFCSEVRHQSAARPLVVCGFSQGGMVACDAILLGGLAVDGLALLSSTRVAIDEWQAQQARLKGLRILISHGRQDSDLAFAAGEALRDFHIASGAEVTWVPFDGGHEIPLVVWRRLRAFINTVGANGLPA